MAIIGNFPSERDWNKVIEALEIDMMSGAVHLSLETRSGVGLLTRAGAQIEAYKKESYGELTAKPKINGVELGANSTSEALGLASSAAVNALLKRIVELEAAVATFTQTAFMIARDPE